MKSLSTQLLQSFLFIALLVMNSVEPMAMPAISATDSHHSQAMMALHQITPEKQATSHCDKASHKPHQNSSSVQHKNKHQDMNHESCCGTIACECPSGYCQTVAMMFHSSLNPSFNPIDGSSTELAISLPAFSLDNPFRPPILLSSL